MLLIVTRSLYLSTGRFTWLCGSDECPMTIPDDVVRSQKLGFSNSFGGYRSRVKPVAYAIVYGLSVYQEDLTVGLLRVNSV